jgi:hypothetical protein
MRHGREGPTFPVTPLDFMQSSQPPLSDTAQCPICRAKLLPALPFCAACGAQLNGESAREEEELRGVLYLLSELARWELSGQVSTEQAAHLRGIYELRRDHLRRELATRQDEKLIPPAAADEAEPPQATHADAGERGMTEAEPGRPKPPLREEQFAAFPVRPPASLSYPVQPTPVRMPRRTLLERLADPQTLRLLLYTGAAMLVVGVVIWLRDLLYLKLQEPIVQAGLLACGTAGLIASGWYTILRTRQRWTGRALTLAGSLLVPVNFWFLVRSGLIENHGRAWVVCVVCALLYAQTAVILRERLYIYLACVASVATLWALILRDAPGAFGLYALALMTAALLFLHLSLLFPKKGTAGTGVEEENLSEGSVGDRWSHELWSAPLVRTALCFAALGALIYMPLRFVSDAPSFYSGIFRLRSSAYDAGIALLILAATAYLLWFTGRYVYSRWSAAFYTISALIFFLAVWTACDGFGLTAQRTVLMMALVTFISGMGARMGSEPAFSQPLYHSSLMVSIALAISSVAVLLGAQTFTLTESAGFALVAAAFTALSTTRFGSHTEQTALAHFAALYFSAAYFIALASASLQSETLVTLLCAAWPLLLLGVAQLTLKLKSETQLSNPFTRVADAQTVLLLLWGSLLALLGHLMGGGISRSSVIVALSGVMLYGALRTLLSRSIFGAELGTLSALVMTAAVLDTLQKSGVWPMAWPIAAGTVVFAFLLERAATRLLLSLDETDRDWAQPLVRTMRVLLDLTVALCALLWLITALIQITVGGFGATAVLLLALLYWVGRAHATRAPWAVRVACAHAAAFLITLLIALSVAPQWLVLLFVLITFPLFFTLSRYARHAEWLRAPLSEGSVAALAIGLLLTLFQAAPHLEAGDAQLLAPSLTAGAVSFLSFLASIFVRGRASVRYFRNGLWVSVLSIMLASLHAGFSPLEDVEVYTTPIAVLILLIAYLSHGRAWQEYDRDVGALLWVGSVLLCLPLLARSLEFRLLLDTPAPWRDVSVLIASLLLILYGTMGRMRAPVMAGSVTLVGELIVLTLTSVDWLQVPLKYYLMTVGALLLLIFGTLEYRREQFLAMRKRFQLRRDSMRAQFGEWR